MAWNTEALLAAVRRTIFAPDVTDQTDVDLLAFADEVLETLIAATIRPGREGYWLTSSDIAIVPGTVEYQVPRRALGRSVRGVMVVKPDGRTYPLTEGDPLVLRERWESSTPATYDPTHYAFEDTTIRVNSVSPSSGWVLRVFYLRTPPRLITVAEGALVLSVSSTKKLLVDGDPPAAMVSGYLIDVVSGLEPYPTLFSDLPVDVTATGEITVVGTPFSTSPMNPPADAPPRQPAYAVPSETTVYPPIVRSLWPSLVKGTAAACLDAQRDPQAASMAMGAEVARRQAVSALSPRDDRRSRAVVGASALRSSRGWGRGRW